MSSKWLDRELHLRLKWSGLALAGAYAICFLVLRNPNLSVDQWYLPAGLRVATLLVFPYRYWPYLFAGEIAAFIYLRHALVAKYGLPWMVVSSSVLMPTAAYIVYRHRHLIRSDHKHWFLSVAVLAAVSITALNIATTYFLMSSGDPVTWDRAARYVVGDYLGILMLAPMALLWKQRKLEYPFPRKLRWDALISFAAIATLCALVVWLPDASDLQKNSLRVLIIVPAAVLTYLHGWRGAAVGIVGANLAIALTMHRVDIVGEHDPDTFLVQVILAVTASVLLGLGSIISHHYRRARKYDLTGQKAIAVARTCVLSSERELRERAMKLRLIGEAMETSLREVIEWLRERGHHAAAKDLQQASDLQSQQFREQLNLVYPSEIELYGLYLALQSSIAKIWAQDAMVFTRLNGNPQQLSLDLQVAAYRSICDAVAILIDCEPGRSLIVKARCGRRGEQCGIAISVGLLDYTARLTSKTLNTALSALAGRVLAYGGSVRCRRNRISLGLSEPLAVASAYRASGNLTDQTTPPASA